MDTNNAVELEASETDSVHDNMHMHLLEKALLKTTGKCILTFKASLFKHHFQPVYRSDRKAILQLHEGAVTELSAKIQEELSLMFDEENVSEFMSRLDQIKTHTDGCAASRPTWRPSGCAPEDIRAHVQCVHQQHLRQLNKVLDQLQSQNNLLHQSLTMYHHKIDATQQAIAQHALSWTQMSGLHPEDHQELELFITSLDKYNVIDP